MIFGYHNIFTIISIYIAQPYHTLKDTEIIYKYESQWIYSIKYNSLTWGHKQLISSARYSADKNIVYSLNQKNNNSLFRSYETKFKKKNAS